MSKAKEKADKLVEKTLKREEAKENSGKALIEKVFKEDSSGDLALEPVFEEALLKEERTIPPLERVVEKVRNRKGADSEKDKNKLRLELAKAIHELQEQNAIDKIDLEIEKYQQKIEQLETESNFQTFNCAKDTIKDEDLQNEPVLFKPNFLTQGEIHILAGKAGSGKSFLSTQMALALATGKPLFKMQATKKQSVAYLSFEDSKGKILQRLKNMGWDLSFIPLQLYTDLSPLLISSGGRLEETPLSKSIVKSIKEQNPNTIIIDTYSQAFLHEDGDNRGSQAVGNWIKKELRGKTVLIIHHVRKAENYEKIEDITLDAIRGASALVGYSRSAFFLGGVDPQYSLKTLKSNYGEPFPDYQNKLYLEKDIVETGGKKVFRGFKLRDGYFDKMDQEKREAAASARKKFDL
jgi:archaellum biogenesis ATPase FlaH